MNDTAHDELREGLGAYALNAMEPLEARRIERHVDECDDCANEVRLLREAAAELSWLSEPADSSELEDRLISALPRRGPSRWTARVLAGVAAVAVAIAGLLGAGLVRERSRTAELTEVLASATRRAVMAPQHGFSGSGVLHLAEGRAALILQDVPDPGRGRTYQLWGLEAGEPTSLGLVEGAGRVVRLFDLDVPAEAFAVTIEPDGGSPVPTTDPVLVGA